MRIQWRITLLLLSLIITSIFISFYTFPYFISYNAETAQHYLEIIKFADDKWLLDGPLTSHHWLRLSSFPYYIFYPLFATAQFHPLTLPVFWLLTSSLCILLNFYVIRHVSNTKIAIISTILYTFSANILILNRNVGFFNFILPITYWLIWELHNVVEKRSKRVWLIFFIVSVMITLHASALMIIPFVIGIIIFLKLHREHIWKSLFAFLIPQLPFFIIDAKNNFYMTSHIILWIPYKVLNFITGKTVGLERAAVKDETWVFMGNFVKQAILPPNVPYWIGLIILVLLLIGNYIAWKKKQKYIHILYILFFFGIISLMIHKNPPFHYFMPIYIFPIFLLSHTVTSVLETKKEKILLSFLIGSIVIINCYFIFSKQFLFNSSLSNSYPPQLAIAEYIIKDAQGKPFELKRIGPFDNYPNEFKDNYEYLMWWLGNRPRTGPRTQYIIVEDKNMVPKELQGKDIKNIENVIIFRHTVQK